MDGGHECGCDLRAMRRHRSFAKSPCSALLCPTFYLQFGGRDSRAATSARTAPRSSRHWVCGVCVKEEWRRSANGQAWTWTLTGSSEEPPVPIQSRSLAEASIERRYSSSVRGWVARSNNSLKKHRHEARQLKDDIADKSVQPN
jgi:hypothetical protein